MTDYAAVLTVNYPDAAWSLTDNDYSTLVWTSEGDAPTQAELDAAWPATQDALALAQAQSSRARAYAAESDPLFFKWQRGEGTEQDWLDAVEAIRVRYPYPGE